MMKKLLLPCAFALLTSTALASDYDGNMRPEVRTSQDDINAGAYSFRDLFYRGAHLFSGRFTTTDGYGEASDGPRRSKQDLAGNKISPFLRFNGLDAQSCLECHSSIGFREFGDLSMAREMGMTAGGGAFSANVFIFEEPNDLTVGLVRSPPHIQGLGYIQRLAEEMSVELFEDRLEALAEAEATGLPVRRELTAKGISFGAITMNPTGGMDTSEIDGVSPDLVIRPFQFKGIASSIRNFAGGALNFHFSVQPAELLRRNLIPNDNPNGTLEDDIDNEILEGDVSTISIFASALRPPRVDTAGLDSTMASRGRELMEVIGCTECHVPSLQIEDPRLTIIDPRLIDFLERRDPSKYRSIVKKPTDYTPSMTSQEPDSEFLPVVLQYRLERGDELLKDAARGATHGRLPGYTYHLTREEFPSESLPRLPENGNRSVDVPLYSDLRRHRMGADLADNRKQVTDVLSIEVAADEFVTRPLWGVADTGPWLHDGRATTLREAILFHAGEGSEANASIDGYKALSKDDQESIIEFMKSLRLTPMNKEINPIPPQTQFLLY